MLDQLVRENLLPDIPVFVDSPLAVNATKIFELHPECFDKDILEYMAVDPNPFGFERLRYTRSVDESKRINNVKGCIVTVSYTHLRAHETVLDLVCRLLLEKKIIHEKKIDIFYVCI